MLDSGLTKYAQLDDHGNPLDLTRYQTLPGGKGVVVPRRQGSGGTNAMVDPRKGASQFRVVDIDEDEEGNLTTRSYAPGTTDVSGNPLPQKETPCPTSLAPSPSPALPCPESSTPPAQNPSPVQAQESSPGRRTKRVKEACPESRTAELELLTTMRQELSQLRLRMTETPPPPAPLPASPPSRPSSCTSVEESKILVEFRAPYGVFRCHVQAIQRDEGLLALVYLADADVQFIPSPGSDVEVRWADQVLRARPHGLAFRLNLGQHYLVVLLSVVDQELEAR